MNIVLHAPQRRMVHNGLDEFEKALKTAKREAGKAFLTVTEPTLALDMVKVSRDAIPQILPEDHDGTFDITDEVRMSVASGLLILSAQLLKKRDAVSAYDVATTEIQNKVDDVEALRAALMDQRDLFEYSSALRDDPNNTRKLLALILPESQMPTLEEISEWPFSWRKEAEAWASAEIEADASNSHHIDGILPPRPSFLPSPKQLPLI